MYFTYIKFIWSILKRQLIHLMPVLPSYRNHPIDLLCKSIDWFLHEGNTNI